MNEINRELETEPMPSSLAVIEQVSKDAERLNAVLEREYQALVDRDIELVHSLVAEKVILLGSLARLEPQLRAVYSAAHITEGEDTVRQLLSLSSELNDRNRSLVLVAIDQNRKSLTLLRSVLKLDQTSVYTSNGELNADQSKRYHGSA